MAAAAAVLFTRRPALGGPDQSTPTVYRGRLLSVSSASSIMRRPGWSDGGEVRGGEGRGGETSAAANEGTSYGLPGMQLLSPRRSLAQSSICLH